MLLDIMVTVISMFLIPQNGKPTAEEHFFFFFKTSAIEENRFGRENVQNEGILELQKTKMKKKREAEWEFISSFCFRNLEFI